MLRTGIVIVTLAAIALALVHIRRQQAAVAHQIQRLQDSQVVLHRRLWDQQAELGRQASPRQVGRRVAEMEDRRAGQWLAADQRQPAPSRQ